MPGLFRIFFGPDARRIQTPAENLEPTFPILPSLSADKVQAKDTMNAWPIFRLATGLTAEAFKCFCTIQTSIGAMSRADRATGKTCFPKALLSLTVIYK